ncbi:hypothetical protein BH18THE2_BH18THE2_37890 [soil metagenome]
MTNWQEIRQQVLERDNYLCQNCFKTATDVHHIIPSRVISLDLFNNLVSLCGKCHALLDIKRITKPRYHYAQHTLNKDNSPVNFYCKPTKMGEKMIIIIPKEFHKEFEKSLGKLMKFKGEEIIN